MTDYGSGQETTLQSGHLSRLWSVFGLRGSPLLPRARTAGCSVILENRYAKGGLPQLSASMTKPATAGVQQNNVNAAPDPCGERATSYGLSDRLHDYFDLGKVLGQGGNGLFFQSARMALVAERASPLDTVAQEMPLLLSQQNRESLVSDCDGMSGYTIRLYN